MHHVNRAVGNDASQGPRPKNKILLMAQKKRREEKNRGNESTRPFLSAEVAQGIPSSHCAMVCHAQALKTLGRMLITLVGDEMQSRKSDSFEYAVDSCHPEYARIPCPLYPWPQLVITPGNIRSNRSSNNWETPFSEDPATIMWQEGRLRTAMDVFEAEDRVKGADLLRQSTENSGNSESRGILGDEPLDFVPPSSGEEGILRIAYDKWMAELDRGELRQCKERNRVSERARQIDDKWCLPALNGPGGSMEIDNMDISSLHRAPTLKPSGHWCSLPKEGSFTSASGGWTGGD